MPSPSPAAPPPFALSVDDRHLFVAEANTAIQRSSDAGASWQQVYAVNQAGSPCTPTITLLVPHPTDPGRLMTDAGCYGGRDFGHGLQQARDGGGTWSEFLPTGQDVNPCTLFGGQGAQPNRWYLVGNPFGPGVSAALLRSDDDGATWRPVLQTEPDVQRLCAGAHDPTNPDSVWIAASQTPDPTLTGVRASSDGGYTWSYLGSQNIGGVNALARAADGQPRPPVHRTRPRPPRSRLEWPQQRLQVRSQPGLGHNGWRTRLTRRQVGTAAWRATD